MSTFIPLANKHTAEAGTRERLTASIRFLRPANLVTAAADILTGAVIVGARASSLPWLVGASVCLYAGGVVLNDYFDRHLDAAERPERAIPSGIVSARIAGGLGAVLLLLGICLAFRASEISGLLGTLLAAAILLYDAFAKPRSFGPVVMGSCRALNLLMGLSAIPAVLAHTWFLALFPFVYIVALTTLSRGEVHGGSVATGRFTLLLFAAVIVGLLLLGNGSTQRFACLLPFALLLLVRVGPPLWRAYRNPTGNAIRAAVHAGIVSLIVLDAALAASYGGVVLGAAILSLAVVTGELAKLFPVT